MGYDRKIREIVITGLMIALVFISGSIIKIPTLNGYIHIGDCMVLLSAVILGKKYGTISSAFGMALVDIMGGYLLWAPFTFIIKGAMTFFAAIIIGKFKEKTFKIYLISFLVAGIIDVVGYFIANAIMGGLLLGESNGFIGSIIYAALHLPGDVFQVIIGVLIALILAKVVYKIKINILGNLK